MSSHGHSHGPAAAGPHVTPGQQEQMINLQSYVDDVSSQVLNADPKTSLKSILGVNAGVLRSDSDVDSELLLVINFREAVKLRGFTLQATEARSEGDADCSGPKTLKLFLNRPHAGFAECASEAPTELITLTPAQLAGTEEIKLKFVKWQNVPSITMFIESNQDDAEVTFINKIDFFGVPLAGFKMSELKSMEHKH